MYFSSCCSFAHRIPPSTAVPSSSASSDNTLKLFDNHMFAKQTRIINDAGHKAIIFTNQERGTYRVTATCAFQCLINTPKLVNALITWAHFHNLWHNHANHHTNWPLFTVDRNPEKDLDKVISAINSDPLHAMSAERMSELKDVRTHIVTMLAHKVAAKKKPTG